MDYIVVLRFIGRLVRYLIQLSFVNLLIYNLWDLIDRTLLIITRNVINSSEDAVLSNFAP